MTIRRIPYTATGIFTSLVLDHLADADPVRPFRPHAPTLAALKQAAAERTFDAGARSVLVNALRAQYGDLLLPDAVRGQLDALARPDALTVVTGHQLCLFGGPLFVPFKLLNAIRLARQLTGELDRPVVPVFWMASEDHDRDEIDHVWLGDTKLRWAGEAGGAVGRMPLHDIDSVLRELDPHLGGGEHADAVRDLLYASYRPDRSLADATRRFIHGLFGRFGLLIIDGDDPALKRLAIPLFRSELIDNVAERAVRYADEQLAERYGTQAHVRGINLFHLRPGHRARIVVDGERYRVLDGGPTFTLEELLELVEQRPEALSPNVMLRPVYQETILPNIAYVGGGGELAYWLQLRWLFQAVGLPMPVLVLRSSAGIIGGKHLRQWEELGLQDADLFASADVTKARVAAERADFSTDLGPARAQLESFYDALSIRVTAADPTLRRTVEARKARALRGLERIGKGLLRAAKRRRHDDLSRMDRILDDLFPGGTPMERHHSMLPLLAAQGDGLLDEWLGALDPLDPRFTLFVED